MLGSVFAKTAHTHRANHLGLLSNKLGEKTKTTKAQEDVPDNYSSNGYSYCQMYGD